MQAAVGADDVGAGPEHEVIGVAEHDLGAQTNKLLGRHGLDRAIGADGHENRGLNHTVRQAQASGTCRAVTGLQFKFHDQRCA